MSSEENAVAQADEIEALSAIYGDEWCVVDEEHKIYCITVDDGTEKSTWTVCIQVHLPASYPSDSPPEYQLNAPWLRGEERRNLEGALADVYCENIGEIIVYLWVEKIREHLQSKTSTNSSSGVGGSQNSRQVTMTTEVDHDHDDDDDFDPSLVYEITSDTSDHSSEPGDSFNTIKFQHIYFLP